MQQVMAVKPRSECAMLRSIEVHQRSCITGERSWTSSRTAESGFRSGFVGFSAVTRPRSVVTGHRGLQPSHAAQPAVIIRRLPPEILGDLRMRQDQELLVTQ